jgi:Domain of unknown function (DUF5916)
MLVHILMFAQLSAGQTAPAERIAAPVPPRAGVAGPRYSGRASELEVRAPQQDEKTRFAIDGALDEPVWATASVLTGFTTYSPVDGRPAQDSTEVRFWYTSEALFLGVRAWAPGGTVRATLAERDRISSDDWVSIHLDTFNDRRRAFVFAVNPLGVQADGMRSEQSAGPGVSRASLAAVDLSQDYVWHSKGRVLPDGFEVEIRIPLNSLRFQMGGTQDWGIQVVRQTQRTGYQDTWAPTSRAKQSFAAQAGYARGMRDLRRGLVLDVTPVATSLTSGAPAADSGDWRYVARQEVGADVRWGVTPNFTLNATANPDFSQVETDVGQIPGDPRFALFFPELRPFFVEGSEQFDAPNRLVYTRQIVQPVAAAKLTGKIPRTDVGLLTAIDGAQYSADQQTNPIFNILRLRRDLGVESTAGLLITDRTEGARYNRVGGLDMRLQFNRVYNIEVRAHGSLTRDDAPRRGGAMWEANTGRSGRSYGFRYGLQGISPDFETRAGFINRNDFVRAQVNQRWTRFGQRGGWWDQHQHFITATTLWTYAGFSGGAPALESRASLDNTITIRGGWRLSAQPEVQWIAFDPRRYSSNRVVRGGDTVVFAPGARQTLGAVQFQLNTPQWRRLGATIQTSIGQDPEFFETATVHRRDVDLSMDLRPSRKARIGLLFRYQRYDRERDGTLFSEQIVPRARLEYQVSRALFFRFIGQVEARRRDALRDPRTELPILAFDSGTDTWAPVSARQTLRGRADWLVQYLPSPGTVVFFGYGSSMDANLTYRPGDFERSADGFFLKLSYLFRAGVNGRGPATGAR